MHWDVLKGCLAEIVKVVPNTLFMAGIILIFGILLGAVNAVIRMKKMPFLSPILTVFTAYLRGTPLIVQLYIVKYSLPYLIVAAAASFFGIQMKAYQVSAYLIIYFTFIINASGQQSENIRGAITSVDYSQTEAALSIGMTERQALLRVVFPQALAVAVPHFLSAYLAQMKLLSLAFLFQVVDILAASKLYSALTYRYTECYIAAALVYWALGIGLTFVFRKLEAHFAVGRRARVLKNPETAAAAASVCDENHAAAGENGVVAGLPGSTGSVQVS